MPGTCRLASIEVSSAQLLFTSFVKKGEGIDRAASHHYTGQVEHRLFSPPEGRTDGPASIKRLSLLPKAKLDWAKGKPHACTTSNPSVAHFLPQMFVCHLPFKTLASFGKHSLFLPEMLKITNGEINLRDDSPLANFTSSTLT